VVCLRIPSSVKVSKVGLRILPLSSSDPLWPEFPPFMLDVLEVVDSLVESPKMCCNTKLIETGSPCSKLQKPDGPVWQTRLSGFLRTNDSQRRHQALTRCSSSGQATSGWWRGVNHDNFGGYGGGCNTLFFEKNRIP
jgi:hypothetical protein